MLKLLTIIGARPQIIKSAAISRAIKTKYPTLVQEVIVHTGQHYDREMSDVFFEELQIPRPNYNLHVGSGKHGEQTAKMITGIEAVIETEKPDCLIIYGDTNSTLAGAIAAAKVHTPIVHIEAGLRSFNKRMPEEINRILSDHVSTYLFPPTQTGFANLLREGFRADNAPPYTVDNPGLFNVGDVMYDNSLYFSELAAGRTDLLERLDLKPGQFLLATLHRNTNTDEVDRLTTIFEAFQAITTSYGIKLVMPVHPRTVKQMNALLDARLFQTVQNNPNILLVPPVSFLEMTLLEQQAKLIMTDSGGVQKEAFFFKKPCIILRSETEWIEIIKSGAALLCDAHYKRIMEAYAHFEHFPIQSVTPIYGDGNAAERILKIVLASL
ncbi:non-hydrolyzing UDP-N-acetylglucosamine 2-epimerase [Larkinella sp. GY13]|uniref:non-hydrolyzing UDP-N-acetylglucosamine 2-epimerase n=1 Tax=Larkinella sp. GY13 TaxID=3453720 RepID=UPI003EEC61E0